MIILLIIIMILNICDFFILYLAFKNIIKFKNFLFEKYSNIFNSIVDFDKNIVNQSEELKDIKEDLEKLLNQEDYIPDLSSNKILDEWLNGGGNNE